MNSSSGFAKLTKIMRILFTLLIFTYYLVAMPLGVRSDEQNQLVVFAKAYALYKEGNSASAKEFFKQTLRGEFALADYSLYFLATIAFDEKQWEESHVLGARLKTEYPLSLWVDTIELQRIKAELAENKFTEAAEALRALGEKKSVSRAILEEALYLQAKAARDDVKYAYSLFQQLRDQFPNSKWTPAARREQAALKEKHPDIFPFHTTASLMAEADQLTRERAFAEAEIIYKKLLNNAEVTDLQLRLLSKISNLYLTLRRRNDAIPLLERIARDHAESAEAPKALYQIGHILWNRHDNTQALKMFEQVLARYPNSSVTDRALFAAGDIYEWLGKKEETIAHYNKIRLRFSQGPVRDDATWRLAWLYYRGGEFPEAYRTFKILASEAQGSALKTAALYWQGRTADKAGDRELAKKIYGEVYIGSEESYYQTLAANALAKFG
ncbi:MAG: tetratricopeptide repeat protein, partial [Deltaproteobacteria bacterium]|nr:tetratricopeptide repeat protein [Deltaproteobacteria bacterium]